MNQDIAYRFERKFVSDRHQPFQVEQLIKVHPFLFSEIFHERRVNNIYFDSPDFEFLLDNIVGNPRRKKFRIRWYGDDLQNIEKPVLEIKIKNGFLGYKRSFPLKAFSVEKDLNHTFEKVFQQADLPEDVLIKLKGLQPKLFNSYKRRYFLSFNRKFRITIDDKMAFHKPGINKISDLHFMNQPVVVELKYDEGEDGVANEVTKHLPYRFSKHSKYENGIGYVYPFLNK